MIPDHLIDKAATAILEAAFGQELPEAPIDLARAALEAVAADIFQHGYNLGKADGLLDRIGIDAPEQPNPYRNEDA